MTKSAIKAGEDKELRLVMFISGKSDLNYLEGNKCKNTTFFELLVH